MKDEYVDYEKLLERDIKKYMPNFKSKTGFIKWLANQLKQSERKFI